MEYANRSLCLSCHQNHGPIFANAPWDETNFNEQVFTKIKSKRENFFGLIPAVPVASAANSIDRSTNRATLLPIYNALWQHGCHGESDEVSKGCRVQAFKSMLQYRLSNKSGFNRNSISFKDDFVQTSTKSWLKSWPNGLAIPMANITDRNPFTEKMEVSARFDPLTPRPPQTIWYSSNLSNLEQVITGLADQIYQSDIELLDSILLNQPTQPSSAIPYANDCVIKRIKANTKFYNGSIYCKDRKRTEENNFELSGTLNINFQDNSASGKFKSLKRTGEFILYDLKFNQAPLKSDANNIVIEFSVSHRKSELSVRLPSGNRLTDFKLELKIDVVNKSTESIVADLSFIENNDFSLVTAAVESLSQSTEHKQTNLFSIEPFSSSIYMSHLPRCNGG